MNIKRLLVAVLFIFSLTACEKKPEIAFPNQYTKAGISFNYPSNWDIEEDEEEGDFRYLIIETPADAMFLIHVYKGGDVVSLEEFAEQISSMSSNETPVGKIESTPLEKTTRKLKRAKSHGVIEVFSMTLLGQEVSYKREFHALKKGGRSAFLFSQGLTENEALLEPGFDLIFKTFEFK